MNLFIDDDDVIDDVIDLPETGIIRTTRQNSAYFRIHV